MAEWTRTDLSYSDRVNHILNGDDPLDPYPLNASTVFGSFLLGAHPRGWPGSRWRPGRWRSP